MANEGLDTRSAEVTAETWFALAHWAKKNDELTSWDRRFAFSQGVRANLGNPASEKQGKHCERILRAARDLGFNDTEDRSNK